MVSPYDPTVEAQPQSEIEPPEPESPETTRARELAAAPSSFFSSHSPVARGQYQYSNRHTYEILEPRVSHRKQAIGCTSNRHKNALCPR